jgi:hypothetical protein
MKRNLIIIAGILAGFLYTASANAQQTPLVQDQNPRHVESERKYARVADTLNAEHGTTIQNTYKAYDWYEARQERRQQNRDWRHEERLNGGYYDYTPSLSLYGGYYYPFNSYRGYGNRWGGRSNFRVGFGW